MQVSIHILAFWRIVSSIYSYFCAKCKSSYTRIVARIMAFLPNFLLLRIIITNYASMRQSSFCQDYLQLSSHYLAYNDFGFLVTFLKHHKEADNRQPLFLLEKILHQTFLILLLLIRQAFS